MRHAAGVLALLAALASAPACSVGAMPSREDSGAKAPAVPPGGVLLRGAGATFPSVLYAEWFRRYQADHPDRVVAYEAVGSGEGIRRFSGRAGANDAPIDFGASDVAMRPDEIAAVARGGVLLPLTAGSVALAYELPDVPGDLKLSREAFAGIFLGTITNWSDPRIARSNPGVKLPNLTISTVVRQDGSGTTFAYTRHLDAVNPVWRSRYGAATLINWPGSAMRAVGNEGVAARIKQSVGAIGYVGYEFARKIGLKVALVENRAGVFVGPTDGSAMAALAGAGSADPAHADLADPPAREAYPIVTLTFVMLYRTYPDPRTPQALHDLFTWCLTDGQQYASGLGYVPLPPGIISQARATLDGVGATATH